MLSVVSSRIDGGTLRPSSTACWSKHGLASTSVLPGRLSRRRHFSCSTMKRRPLYVSEAHSDLTENLHVEANSLDPEKVAPSETADPEDAVSESSPPSPAPTEEQDIQDSLDDRSELMMKEKEPRKTKAPFSIGEEVTVLVTGLRRLGATVDIEEYPDCKGYLPVSHFPLPLLPHVYTPLTSAPKRSVYNHLKRKAVITAVGVSASKVGPIINTYQPDKHILHQRLTVLKDLCRDGKETIRGYINARNKAGLVVAVAGFAAFLPRSLMTTRQQLATEMPAKDFVDRYLGSEVEVVVKQLEPEKNRLIVSSKDADAQIALKSLAPCSLISGVIRNFTEYGAFVKIDGTDRHGLLHIKNYSGKMIRYPDGLFVEGEMIKALIVDMQSDWSRISLSTADLEEYPGEILYDKNHVMENAETMAQRWREKIYKNRLDSQKKTSENV